MSGQGQASHGDTETLKVPITSPTDNAQTARTQAGGSAYDFIPGHPDEDLVRVGRGTPGGELLRRYWHPIAASTDAVDVPLAVKVLGEDLILFRDKQGRPGLLYPRCVHRGTSLFFGRIEEEGIRCCYHGWLFDTEGRCRDQPCEPDRGSAGKDRVRQPWYPVKERYGLIWAYLGPLDRMPALPRYELLEDLEDGRYEIFVDAHHWFTSDPQPADYNWFQKAENTVDPFHVFILHNNISGEQFNSVFSKKPVVRFEYSDVGVRCTAVRPFDEHNNVHRTNDLVFPNVACIGDPRLHRFDRSVVFSWFLPEDDESMKDFIVVRATPDIIEKVKNQDYTREIFAGHLWTDMTEEEHQRAPWDYEAQLGQGKITLHSEEHLVSSDAGISMYRRQFRENMRLVAEGEDPLNISYDEDAPPIRLTGGNYAVSKIHSATSSRQD